MTKPEHTSIESAAAGESESLIGGHDEETLIFFVSVTWCGDDVPLNATLSVFGSVTVSGCSHGSETAYETLTLIGFSL